MAHTKHHRHFDFSPPLAEVAASAVRLLRTKSNRPDEPAGPRRRGVGL